jgi:hypothetical protein
MRSVACLVAMAAVGWCADFRAGSIQNADGRKVSNTRIQAADGSRVRVTDSKSVTGLMDSR